MKYKAIYDVLNERRQTTPGFCYHDRSGWRAYPQTYMTMHALYGLLLKMLPRAGVCGSLRRAPDLAFPFEGWMNSGTTMALPIALLVKTGQSWLKFCAISSSQKLWLCS